LFQFSRRRLALAVFLLFLVGATVFRLGAETPIKETEIPIEEGEIVDPHPPGVQAQLDFICAFGTVGDNLAVDVVISNVTYLMGYEFKLGYDANILAATEIAVGEFFSDFVLVKKETNHTGGWAWLAVCTPFGSPHGVTGSGVLATITFEVRLTGSCNLTLYDTVMVGRDACLIQPKIDLEVKDGYFGGEICEHNLAVLLDAPNHLEPGDSWQLKARVVNRGLCNETDVQLRLLIDDYVVNSTVISWLYAGASSTLDYFWIPTIEKTFNFTAYAAPVSGENHVSNNVISASVVVRSPIKVPEDYTTIREAMDSAVSGEVILVSSGVYYEQSLTIDKSVKLLGEDSSTTIIDGNGAKEMVLIIVADCVTISGFTIRNSFGGVLLSNSNDTNFVGNTIADIHDSLSLLFCYGSIIAGNTLRNNHNGIVLAGSHHNIIHHNNFINNTVQVQCLDSSNIWNNGAGEGNYWSDYNGTDLDGDGIGDEHLPWEQVDFYPLVSLVTKVDQI